MAKFTKKERLCSTVEIQKLFKNGNCFLDYPFSVRYNFKGQSCDTNVLVLISVPKRYHKHAVERNRIKRLLRECFRNNKELIIPFLIENDLVLQVSISHISNEVPKFDLVNLKVINILNRIISLYKKQNPNENYS